MYFDYENKDKVIKTFKETWEEFRQALGTNKIGYKELSKAKEYTFLGVLDNVLSYENNNIDLEVLFKTLYFNYSFCRATEIKSNEIIEKIDFDRFLPNKEYSKDANRFSPTDKEYLYLACKTRFGKEKHYDLIEEISKKEIRAREGQKIGICKFKIPENLDIMERRVINLTLVDNISLEDINQDSENWINNYIYSNINTNKSKKVVSKEIKEETRSSLLKIYLKILSSEIFKPVENVDRDFEYAPFHCLAYYFSKLGYDGIIYKSTVCNNGYGKNIVLFNKYYAEPFEFKFIEM